MSQDQLAKESRRQHGSPPRELTSREIARMILNIGTSEDVLKGRISTGRLTQDEVDGLAAYLDAPLTNADFDDMDRLSSPNSRLSRAQVYIILILLFEAHWRSIDIAQTFSLNPGSITAIKHGHSWPGTYQRYCRDRGLDPSSLTPPPADA